MNYSDSKFQRENAKEKKTERNKKLPKNLHNMSPARTSLTTVTLHPVTQYQESRALTRARHVRMLKTLPNINVEETNMLSEKCALKVSRSQQTCFFV